VGDNSLFGAAQESALGGRNSRAFSVIENAAGRRLGQNSRISLYFSLLAGNLDRENGSLETPSTARTHSKNIPRHPIKRLKA
jgi:hypothetical protein